MQPRRLTLLVVLGVVLLGPVSAQPGLAAGYQPVFADGGGGDAAASIYCTPGLIRLGQPVISAIPPGDAISSQRQWVAWNVTIWYSQDGASWSPSGATPYWYFGLVNDRYAIADNALWFSSEQGGWSTNLPSWNAFWVGYYLAQMQLVWYFPDGTVSTLTPQLPAYTLGADGDWAARAPSCAMY